MANQIYLKNTNTDDHFINYRYDSYIFKIKHYIDKKTSDFRKTESITVYKLENKKLIDREIEKFNNILKEKSCSLTNKNSDNYMCEPSLERILVTEDKNGSEKLEKLIKKINYINTGLIFLDKEEFEEYKDKPYAIKYETSLNLDIKFLLSEFLTDPDRFLNIILEKYKSHVTGIGEYYNLKLTILFSFYKSFCNLIEGIFFLKEKNLLHMNILIK